VIEASDLMERSLFRAARRPDTCEWVCKFAAALDDREDGGDSGSGFLASQVQPVAATDCNGPHRVLNLFAAGRTADGDQKAGVSLRVMGTPFATGQGGGVAAAQYARAASVGR